MSEVAKNFEVKIGTKKYIVTPMYGSMSAKLVFKIQTNGNDFIIKIAPLANSKSDYASKKYMENQALRPDMPYLDAMVDFY